MVDVFISYAREDLTRAKTLALALEKQGKAVWWDRTIPAGKIFDEVIDEAIQKARCIIVLWSVKSSASRWVRTEAEEGAKRDILVPVLIEKTEIPLAFRRFQAADLIDWDGASSSPSFQKLLQDVATVLGPSPQPTIGELQAQRWRPSEEQTSKIEQPPSANTRPARAVNSLAAKLTKTAFLGVVSFVIALYASWVLIEVVSGDSQDSAQTVMGSGLVATIVTAVVLVWHWRRR